VEKLTWPLKFGRVNEDVISAGRGKLCLVGDYSLQDINETGSNWGKLGNNRILGLIGTP
jgi:hypothetical protein